MLWWSRRARALVLLVFGALVAVLVIAPLLTLLLASVTSAWNGVLPSAFTGAHLARATNQDGIASLLVSTQTAVVAGGVSLVVGGWAALAADSAARLPRRIASALCHLPLAVPSVVIGLGLLIAFNGPPLTLGGTRWIVILAHAVLVLAFTFSTVASALRRQDPELVLAARSLGASELRVLCRVRLPLLVPAFAAAAGLSVALSMGELGATIMVYPPSWRTLPVTIFALSDRGEVFAASASTVVLLASTVLLLLCVGRLRALVTHI